MTSLSKRRWQQGVSKRVKSFGYDLQVHQVVKNDPIASENSELM
jgi:hypothetical protein